LVAAMKEIKVGPSTDFTVFTSAVIDDKAYQRITGYIEHAKENLTVIHGGEYSKK